MDTPGINIELFTIVQELGADQLSRGEVLYLTRRLSYRNDAEAWNGLQLVYRREEPVLRKAERYLLERLSGTNLHHVRSRLRNPTSADVISNLTEHERQNLMALVERALPLQACHSAASIHVSDEQMLATCPTVIVSDYKHPHEFLELLGTLHTWLHETVRTPAALRQWLEQQWRPMLQYDFQHALDLLYALGIIANMDIAQLPSQVQPTQPVNQPLPQFRCACAEKFARRVSGNHALLAAIDHLNHSPLNQITRTAFGGANVPDLKTRLTIFEALGVIQREKKQHWSVTQAGRLIVASLQPIMLFVADMTEPAPKTVSSDDWLNVL